MYDRFPEQGHLVPARFRAQALGRGADQATAMHKADDMQGVIAGDVPVRVHIARGPGGANLPPGLAYPL